MRARRRSPVPVAVQFRRLRAVGTVDAGPDAVGKLLLSAAGAWSPLGAALLVPVARSAAHVLYRLVADNRSRLPGRSGACAVPEPRSARSPTGAPVVETGPMEGVEARDVEFPNGPVRLAGSLSVPRRGAAARAGVVLVGGSGPTDRHNGTFFPPLRRHLLDAGVTVLSYDKRGVGGSSGDWRAATLTDLAADATAALDFLRSRPGVPAETAGFFGHSEGGWVVLRAATARDDLPWVVTNSCPGTTPAVQERHALAQHLRVTHAHSPNDVDRTLALYDRLIEAGRRDADFATALRLVDQAGRPPGLEFYWGDVDESLWSFLKRKQDHDPTGDLRGLRCPHLALFGGADPLIPVADTLRALGTSVAHASRPRHATLTVEVFPGADHRLRLPDAAEPPPEYFTRLTDWLRRR